MGITAPGIGSSLDVNAIVSQLMAVERQPLALLERRESDYQAKLSAYGTLKGALSTFQAAMNGLADATKFEVVTASAADPSLFTTSADGKAVPGSYSLEIEQLAQQQKIRSEGFVSTSSVVGSGTLTIQYGTYDNGLNTFTLNSTKSAQTVTIDPSNNTLSGIRDSINAGNIGVSATIINDGSSNRLVLTAKDAGAANSIRITVNDDDGVHGDAAGLSQLAFDPTAAAGNGKNLTQAQAAQDAKLQIDGIAISKSSNTITDAIEGVTLNLLKSNPDSTTTLNVTRDGAGIKTSVEAFVKAFNTVNQTLSDLSSYNAGNKKGAILQGDSAALSIQRWLRSTVTAATGSTSEQAGSLTSLSQIGVSFQKDGTLAVDATKLQAAIDGGFDHISSLFATSAKPADSLIAYHGSSDKTTAGRYLVAVTQLATQGVLTGSQAAGLTISAGVNDQVDITVDGVLASINLSAGTYASADALAAELQSKLNGAGTLTEADIEVVVSQSGGALNITSARYGSASGVTLSGSNGGSNLFGASSISTPGVDVAGSIDGVAATGSGRILTAGTGSPAEGLRLTVEGGALGARGSVDFSRGYADRLSKLVEDLLADDGLIAARVDGINASIKDIDRRQEDFMQRLSATEARYRRQFTALDTMLASLNQTSQFLQQQLASLPKINSQT
jgi:flagellar hook-associated protein 2